MRLDLAEYDLQLQHIKGRNSAVADALSKISIQNIKNIPSETMQILAITRSMEQKTRRAAGSTDHENSIAL